MYSWLVLRCGDISMCNQTRPIGLIGSGLLHQAVRSQLEQSYLLVSLSIEELTCNDCSYALLVLVEDGWNAQAHTFMNQYSLKHSLPWLCVSIELGTAVIGPCVFPWESGCATCVETRKITAMTDAADFARLREHIHYNDTQKHSFWLTAFSIEVVASLVMEEITTFLKDPDHLRTRNALLHLRLDSLRTSVHRFLPDPHCPDCTHLSKDTAEAAIITLQSQPKLAPFIYRVRSLAAELDSLQKLYVDEHTGMISQVMRDSSNLYANVGVRVGLYRGQYKESGFGRTLSYRASLGAALAEALERHAGTQPQSKKTTIRASYNQLGSLALDPTTLGLYSREQYALPNYPYIPYHHDLVCNWVWGYSFGRRQPILIPQRCVYYGIRYQDTMDRPLIYETSNGCALGSCLEEAILHGILEIAERDAFLLTWYARLQVPRIDPFTAADRSIRLLIERLEHITGYTVYAFNITLEQHIPCFWVMAVDEQKRPDRPRAICAAGSHLHPEKALANAIHELAPHLQNLTKRFQEERKRAMRMLDNPFAVARMEDHALLYGLPEAFERLRFLYASLRQHSFQEAFSDFYDQDQPEQLDLSEDLNNLIASYLTIGLDVIVVDQTSPEQMAGQFRCVKVIIPGTLPMSFGYHARRITGLERLYQLPHRLGYYPQPLTEAEVNPYPHPFP